MSRRTPNAALCASVVLLLFAAMACSDGPARPLPRPGRIILMTMDTVGLGHTSLSGRVDTTPTLDEIARGGWRFSRAYAAANYTIPSHMTMFTGLDPAEHRVDTVHAALHPDVPTLASLLRGVGYRTQSFNEGGFVSARFGFSRGFDSYDQLKGPLVGRANLERVVRYIVNAGDDPYFLFLHTYAAHYPYGGYERYRKAHPERGLPSRRELAERARQAERAGAEADPELEYLCTLYNQLNRRGNRPLQCGHNRPPDWFAEHPDFARDLRAIVRSYENRIRSVDAALRVIRDALVSNGQWEDTLLIVIADHGDAFFEHGLYRHVFVPFDEVMRIPFVISYPALASRTDSGGTVIEGLTSHHDLLPTILEIVGIRSPEGLQGISLLAMMKREGEIPPTRTLHVAALRAAQKEQEPIRRIVLRDGHKLIEGHETFGDSEGLLFDVASDPGEQVNLRTEQPETYAALLKAARDYEATLRVWPPVDQRTGRPLDEGGADPQDVQGLDDEEQAHLRELGYIE